jgi:L-ascorbate metabolism protein UlaG (beta-lactamase superfamily)
MLKILGIILLILVAIIVVIVASIIIYVYTAPVFGAKPSRKKRKTYREYDNYKRGKFSNIMPQFTVFESAEFKDESLHPKETRTPDFELPIVRLDKASFDTKIEAPRITWFGHSTLLVEMEGKTLLIDPMFGGVASPLLTVGNQRFKPGLPLSIEDLPAIDAVLMTHDHYDHLDYESILAIKDRVPQFFIPLGMHGHLRRWGIPAAKIQEFNWYEETKLGDIRLVFTPSHHYSGRSWRDRFLSLWGGWIMQSSNHNIYLSGDGGYGPHFSRIGEEYGPFDFAMMECGQYSRYWRQNHLFPEEAAKAAHDVKAEIIMPIHWGGFALAMHSWDDPVKRFLEAAATYEIPVTTPKIGEFVLLDEKTPLPSSHWWERSATS